MIAETPCVGGPFAGRGFRRSGVVSPAYRDGDGRRIERRAADHQKHYRILNGRYFWRPALRKIVTPVVDMPCPQCGGLARKLAGAVDFICAGNVSDTCEWWNLTCRGCGLAPREGQHGIALCGVCRAGEFAHLFEIGEELS